MKPIVTLLVGLALLWPASALAQSSSTCQAYNPQLCGVSGTTTSRSPVTAADSGSNGGSADPSTLPFTGLDVALIVAGGAALLAAGLVVRRLSRLD